MAANNTLKPVIRLVSPHNDKGWSFQGYWLSEDQLDLLKATFIGYGDLLPEVKLARPFLQGYDLRNGWIMIEFWTKDKSIIDNATAALSKVISTPILHGDFTREELGLS